MRYICLLLVSFMSVLNNLMPTFTTATYLYVVIHCLTRKEIQ